MPFSNRVCATVLTVCFTCFVFSATELGRASGQSPAAQQKDSLAESTIDTQEAIEVENKCQDPEKCIGECSRLQTQLASSRQEVVRLRGDVIKLRTSKLDKREKERQKRLAKLRDGKKDWQKLRDSVNTGENK